MGHCKYTLFLRAVDLDSESAVTAQNDEFKGGFHCSSFLL